MFRYLLRWFLPLNYMESEPPFVEAQLAQPIGPEELDEYEHPYPIPTKQDIRLTYGVCGEHKLLRLWERKNMVVIKGLPGHFNRKSRRNTPGNCRMYVNYKMAPALQEALHRCAVYGVVNHIYKLGCFKWRKKRTSSQLSHHSWGVAVDINPADGLMHRYKRGEAPVPWSNEWWEVWPEGPPKLLIQAFKESGFSWGGDWETCPDPMHLSLVR